MVSRDLLKYEPLQELVDTVKCSLEKGNSKTRPKVASLSIQSRWFWMLTFWHILNCGILITNTQDLKSDDCWVTQILWLFFLSLSMHQNFRLEFTLACGPGSSFPAYLPVALANSAEQGHCPSTVWLGHCCPLFQEQTTYLQFAPSGCSCQG